MKATETQIIESYQRVQVFLTGHPLPPPATYGEAKALLDEVVAHLMTHSGHQAATTRLGMAETERQRMLRRALREQHLVPIARIATAVLRGSPGIDKATRLPSPQLPTTKLVADAAAIREAAALYEETFVRQGLSADFLARLDAAIEERASSGGWMSKNPMGTTSSDARRRDDRWPENARALESVSANVSTRTLAFPDSGSRRAD